MFYKSPLELSGLPSGLSPVIQSILHLLLAFFQVEIKGNWKTSKICQRDKAAVIFSIKGFLKL